MAQPHQRTGESNVPRIQKAGTLPWASGSRCPKLWAARIAPAATKRSGEDGLAAREGRSFPWGQETVPKPTS